MRCTAAFAALCLAALAALAADPRPFDAASADAIRKAEAGRPFLLSFWSITCEPCREDMKVLREAQRRHPGLRVHLVNVDAPGDRAAVAAFLKRYDPGPAVRWAFADDFAERVRYGVDPGWRGELPRTYLYDARTNAVVVSGVIDAGSLERWLAGTKELRPR